MAGRKIEESIPYFKHRNGMRDHRKLKAVRAKFGIMGYAIYNMLLETLAQKGGQKVPFDDLEIELLAGDFGVDSKTLKDCLLYMNTLNLIQISDVISCNSLEDEFEPILEYRKAQREKMNRKRQGKQEAANNKDSPSESPPEINESELLRGTIELLPVTNELLSGTIQQSRVEKSIVYNYKEEEGEAPLPENDKLKKYEENPKLLFISYWRKQPSMFEIQSVTKLIEEFGIEKIRNAFHVSMEQGKTSIAYLRGVLNENGRNSTHKPNTTNGRPGTPGGGIQPTAEELQQRYKGGTLKTANT